MRLHPSRLSLLVDAADRGSIAAVARLRGCTASAVSQQLALLERDVQAQLLTRTPSGVTLTPVGERLVGHARRALRVLEEAERDLDAALGDGRPSGSVEVGAVASAAAVLLSPAVRQLDDTHPLVDVRVSDMEPARSLQAVRLGDLDLAVVDVYDHVPPAPVSGVLTEELLTEPLVVVVPPHLHLPEGPVDLATLADLAWVCAPQSAACGEAVRNACHAFGFAPDVRWSTDDLYLSVHHVAAGHGVALLPMLVARSLAADVTIRPVGGRPMRRTLVAATRLGAVSSPALDVLMSEIRKATDALRGSLDAS